MKLELEERKYLKLEEVARDGEEVKLLNYLARSLNHYIFYGTS